MNEKNILQSRVSPLKKLALVLLGLILSLVILEVGMRLGGFVLLSIQEYRNLRSIQQKGTYRILCLGESTTQHAYPQRLEQILNPRNSEIRFSVIDAGRSGTDTRVILSRVESDLAEYQPDMVVAMMGINDRQVKYYQGIPEAQQWIFQHCRVYRLGRILWAHFFTKNRREATEMGLCKPAIDKSISVKAETSLKVETSLSETEQKETSPEAISDEGARKKAVGLNPKGDNADVERGRLHLAQGEFQDAEDSFKKAIERNPENDSTYFELGELYLELNQFSKAEDSFKKAIEHNPTKSNFFNGLARAYRFQNEYSKSEDFFKKTIEMAPENVGAYIELGIIYEEQGKFSQCENMYRQAVEHNPENVDAFIVLGVLYRNQSKWSEAEGSFRRAIEIDPENGIALRAMATLYGEMGKPELAAECAQKANELRSEYYPPVTVNNYRRLKEILDRKGIKLVCVQYPVRNVTPLKRIFENEEGVIFVDNESLFKEALKKEGYKAYFVDMFGGDFGHCTPKGNTLLAQNIADVILREVFNK